MMALLGLAAALLALAEFAVPRPRAVWLRFALQLACLACLTASLRAEVASPVAPVFTGGLAARDLLDRALAIAWWALAARVAVTLARLLLTREGRPREARIMSDLLAGLIYLAAALAVVAFVFGIPVRGVLATSGVIAIVLGLALQSTLSDLFSGIAVGVERPYRTGDLLAVDGAGVGRVVQVNWRSTHIMVGQDVAIVPNSVVAKSRLVNRSAPTAVSSDTLEVRVHPGVPPNRVLPVLRAALLGCETLAPTVAPSAECAALAGDGTSYALHFAAASADQMGAVRSDVLSQVHRHLFHAGIPLAVPGVVPDAAWQPVLLSPQALLARSDLFAPMSEAHRAALAAELGPVELTQGEVLFRDGDAPTGLNMIASGVIEIVVGGEAAPRRRLRLGPGETIGIVGLVTGQPHGAVATALTACRLFHLEAPGLARALEAEPELGEALEATVRRTLQMMARFDAAAEPTETTHHGALLGRLRAFLKGLH